jgi:HD-like signal output (HDOD) protein/ActR/RegA family two-component response regulator
MTKLLFVDDEPHILEGLRRMMRRVRDQWEVKTATSGAEALAIMAEWPADVVVSDMRMPHMNGVELLNRIAREYPEAVRLILSGHTDREVIMQSAIVAHQFLAKPCNAGIMVNTLHRAKTVRELLGNPSIRDIVGRTMQLPCLSSTYAELMKVLGTEGSTIRDVSDVIARDLVLTARVMQLVNSSFFSNARRIDSIIDAVAYLGLDVVRGLVAAVKAFDGFEHVLDEQSLINLFMHCLQVGSLCRQIAIQESMTIRDQEDALLTGMMHDIGKLVLAQAYPESFRAILDGREDWWPEAAQPCREAKISHAEVGAYLLGLWGFQNHIVEAVAYHERPREAPVLVFSLATILHVANAKAMERPDLVDGDYLALVGKRDAYSRWFGQQEVPLAA